MHVSRALVASILTVAVLLAAVSVYAGAHDGRTRVAATTSSSVALLADDGADQARDQDSTGGAFAPVTFVVLSASSDAAARLHVTARLAHALPAAHPPAPLQIRC